MKRMWKRNIVVGTVLMFVCAAVYMNWQYADNLTETAAEYSEQKVLGQSTLVSSETEIADGEERPEDLAADYFSTARLTRQQARDSAISLLREAAESEVADTAVANEAAETIQVLAGYALAEAQIENLVTAKGYVDCVAFMGDSSISVVVSTGEAALAAADVAKITDIVLTETDYTADQIKILEAN